MNEGAPLTATVGQTMESGRSVVWGSTAALLKALLKFAKRKPTGAASLVLIVVVWLIAIFAPALAPYPPTEVFVGPTLAAPTSAYPLGTDDVGRDVFSRLVFGARLSLSISLVATLVGTAGGLVFGMASGYLLGVVDLIGQRVIDALISMPTLIVLMVVAFVLGGQLLWITLAVAFVTIPRGSRIFRAAAISLRENAYVEAASALGATDRRIIVTHILPNMMPTVIVLFAISLGQNILLQSALSFLGLVSSQSPDWGAMLNVGARRYMVAQPWLALAPGIVISVTVLAYNLLGDALRDVLDPRLRGT